MIADEEQPKLVALISLLLKGDSVLGTHANFYAEDNLRHANSDAKNCRRNHAV